MKSRENEKNMTFIQREKEIVGHKKGLNTDGNLLLYMCL